MVNKKIFYRGFLSNTDDSILQLRLKNGLKIRAIPDKEAFQFIMDARGVNNGEALKILFEKCKYNYCSHALKPNPVYIIENSIHNDGKHGLASIHNNANHFSEEILHGYLTPTLRLIRLFKEGYLCVPVHNFYTIENGKPKVFMTIGQERYSDELFHLESSELNDLYTFLEKTELPFKEGFLQVAFSNFEVSYRVRDVASSFLNLMMSLECLFNPARSEVRYRVSRNVAVLLGKTVEESEIIFSEVKKLYDKRSEVIHTGNTKRLTQEDVLMLRSYVRESIKKMYNLKGTKDEILNLLNSRGFGENDQKHC